jgi:hypothetical protein
VRLRRRNHSESHPVRNTLIGLFLVFLVLMFVPDLGAGYAQQTRHNHQSVLPQDDGSDNSVGGLFGDKPQEILTWTVLRHQGYNPEWQCWILQLDRTEGPQHETTGQFCAKDKADYDAHANGSTYQTKGDWLDNLTPPGARPRSDST